MNPAPVFQVRDLRVVKGGSLILNIPSLVISAGEILVLFGPNGAGKSTLLQTLSSLLKPTRGEIFFKGRRIGVDIPVLQHRRRLAMVLQEPLLFDTTVHDNVASGLKIRGMKRSEMEPIVNSALDRFGIAHLKDRSARTLSGGEARRVSIARAFATNPEVLLLDEPFSALDPIIRETLMGDLEHVLGETRMTTIFVTHDRTEALRLATRMGVMKDGQILQTGSPDEVMNHPRDEFVASLMGLENILHGRVIQKNAGSFIASVSGRDIEAAGRMDLGTEVVLCIRSECVSLSTKSPTNSTTPKNVFSGKVKKITPTGIYQKVRLDCGIPLVAYVTSHSLSDLSLKEGSEVLASFSPPAVHVIDKG